MLYGKKDGRTGGRAGGRADGRTGGPKRKEADPKIGLIGECAVISRVPRVLENRPHKQLWKKWEGKPLRPQKDLWKKGKGKPPRPQKDFWEKENHYAYKKTSERKEKETTKTTKSLLALARKDFNLDSLSEADHLKCFDWLNSLSETDRKESFDWLIDWIPFRKLAEWNFFIDSIYCLVNEKGLNQPLLRCSVR